MKRSVISFLVLAAVAGCAGSNASDASPDFVPGTTAHIMPMHRDGVVPMAQGQPHLVYNGGSVLSNVKVEVVFWGSSVDSGTKSQIGPFYSAVTDSAYFDWLGEYNTTMSGGTQQAIGRGSYAGAVTITPSTSATSLDDTTVQAELNAQINSGALPAPDANTIYMTYFPPGISITMQGQQSCQVFCAYHGAFQHNGAQTFYGVMPDFGPTSSCHNGCGNGAQFDNLTSASTHELIEAVTDPGDPLSWYDNANGEIGDICANDPTDVVAGYTVQREWSNSRNACISADASSTPAPTPTGTGTTAQTPTPTPTGNPTGTPGNQANGDSHTATGCSVTGLPAGAGSVAAAAVMLLLCGAAIARRREE